MLQKYLQERGGRKREERRQEKEAAGSVAVAKLILYMLGLIHTGHMTHTLPSDQRR